MKGSRDDKDSLIIYAAPMLRVGPQASVSVSLNDIDSLNAAQSKDALDMMLPPIEWTDESGTWIQSVDKSPTHRGEAVRLKHALKKKINTMNARKTGICPIREQIYADAFDEMIRQVTLECPERGLLLLRIRNEKKMTLDVYRALCESSSNFGIQKHVSTETGTKHDGEIEELEEVVEKLKTRNRELEEKMEILKQLKTAQEVDEQNHFTKKREHLLHYQHQLKTFLKSLDIDSQKPNE